MGLLEILIAAVLSTLGFNIFLKALNMSMLKLFVPIQKKTSKLRKKSLLRSLIGILCVVFVLSLVKTFNLNNVMFGILLGFFVSFESIIFEHHVEL